MAYRAWRGVRSWTEDEAPEILRAQERSGLTVAEFARQEGIKPHVLYRWRRQHGSGTGTKAGGGRDRKGKASDLTLVPVDLPIVEPVESIENRFTVELGCGTRLHIPPKASPEQVEALLGVLQRCC
jgi:transposase-like protein